MNIDTTLFDRASVEEIMQGFIYDDERSASVCLHCEKSYEEGVIYQEGTGYYEARRAIRMHIEKEHPAPFESLLDLDRKHTGLTEHVKMLLLYFYRGYSDNEIVTLLGGGSTSTVRNHRFVLREREKQARLFCAIMGLLEKQMARKQRPIPPHRTATMVDDRYHMTEQERDEIIKTYFREGPDGPLAKFPGKQKQKIPILAHIAAKFDRSRRYSEKEVNEILMEIYPDHVTIRRYLIEYGFLDRKSDGTSYWVKV